jgi:MoxR-like ATPase
METIKAGRPVIEFVKLCYRANRSPLLEGRHGLGKTELLEQAAAEMGIDLIVRDLSLMEPPDLVGIPRINGKTTKYLPPDFLPTGGKGILCFEELNRAEKYMRAPCLQLLTARTLNDYRLPAGWLPAAVINPAEGELVYEVFDLDPALLSRFVRAALVPDQAEWLEWARRNRIHAAVRDYVAQDPSVFEHEQSNPRAWKYVSDVVTAHEAMTSDTPSLRAAVVGLVGDKRGAAFLRTLTHGDRPLEVDDLLADYVEHYQAMVRGWIKAGKLDLLKTTLLCLKKYLQPKRDFDAVKAARKKWANLAKFLYDLPGDMVEDMKNSFDERGYDFPRRPRK